MPTYHPTTRRAVLGLGLAALTGCSAAPVISQPTSPTPTVQTPDPTPVEGQTLQAMGLRYGPRNFTLPDGVVPTRIIDQDNVVTMIFSPADGVRVHDHLVANLSGWGWTITATSEDSLIFNQPGWDGAMTISTQIAGLTLRVVPPN